MLTYVPSYIAEFFRLEGSSGYLAKILRCVKFLDRWASMSGRGVSDFNTIMSGLYLSQ